MKRLLFTVALCMVASASFAQKKAVNQAQNIAKGDNANYDEARSLVQAAMNDPESKDDAKTYFVAGFIEDQEFSKERTKQILGQEPDEPVMYEALIKILPYMQKALELDQLPNEKGKVKPRFTKDIKGILSADHVYYINGGAYYFDERNYPKAYEFFNQYIEIAGMDIFKGEQVAERDSQYMMVEFYAAIAATQMDDPDKAIAALNRVRQGDYRTNDVLQYLHLQYEEKRDTASIISLLQEGMQRVPEEPYYLMHLINVYIHGGRNQEAITYINEAIAKEPNNAQLYDVLGRVYETGLQDYENAEKYFQKALEIDPNYADAVANLGRIYYNQAVNKLGEANMINDSRLYQEESQKAKDYFRQALPYFEKAHELSPTDAEIMTPLRTIYYNLQMGDKFDEIEAKMNNR